MRMAMVDTDILLVDDDKDTCASMSDIFIDLDYTVDMAYDGPGALELSGRHQYHLALLDFKMPGMDGLELLTLEKIPAERRGFTHNCLFIHRHNGGGSRRWSSLFPSEAGEFFGSAAPRKRGCRHRAGMKLHSRNPNGQAQINQGATDRPGGQRIRAATNGQPRPQVGGRAVPKVHRPEDRPGGPCFREAANQARRKWVAVFMNQDTIVIALHGSLTAAEKALVQSPAGAARVREFHRQVFTDASAVLHRKIKSISGMEVRDTTAEIEPKTGHVVQLFTTDTVGDEFLSERLRSGHPPTVRSASSKVDTSAANEATGYVLQG